MNDLILFIALLILVLLIGNIFLGDNIVTFLGILSGTIMIYNFIKSTKGFKELLPNSDLVSNSANLGTLKDFLLGKMKMNMNDTDKSQFLANKVSYPEVNVQEQNPIISKIIKNVEEYNNESEKPIEVTENLYDVSMKKPKNNYIYVNDILSEQTRKRNERFNRSYKSSTLSKVSLARNVPVTHRKEDWINRPHESIFFK